MVLKAWSWFAGAGRMDGMSLDISTNTAQMSLLSCTAGCLATYLEDLLEYGEDAISCLDAEEKQALLAIARRQACLP